MSLRRELELERQLELERARQGLLAFICYQMPTYEPSWHHTLMAGYLDQVADGRIKRLIVTMPPRHGKSQQISMHFPAFLLGRNPKEQIIAASYNATLAARMNRSVQRVIDSSTYRDVFPDTTLSASNIRTMSSGNWLRNSDEFETVGHGGMYRSAGVGGSATGYGATCFYRGALVETECGKIPIENFWGHPSPPRVWGYNHRTGRRQLCRVTRVSRARDTRKISVQFAEGGVFACTPGHLVYTREGGYRQADQCDTSTHFVRAAGARRRRQASNVLHPLPEAIVGQGEQPLHILREVYSPRIGRDSMCALQEEKNAGVGRVLQGAFGQKDIGFLLQPAVRKTERCAKAAEDDPLPLVLKAISVFKGRLLHIKDILLKSLRKRIGEGPSCQAESEVRNVSKALPIQNSCQVLQHDVQEQRSLETNGRNLQPIVRRWKVHNSSILQSHLPKAGSAGAPSRQKPLRVLRQAGFWRPGASAPHQRKEKRQSVIQSNFVLRKLPFEKAPLRHAQAKVVAENCQAPEYVYDLQIEECNNYFVAETLVHNCGIVDDPVRNRADASSPTYQQRTWEWFTSTFYSRLEKGGRLIVVATRWNENDLIGQLLQHAEDNPDSDKWVVLNLPAIAEADRHADDPRDEGEPLWPDKYDLKQLARMRATMGERDWASLYMQRPSPTTGDIVKKTWWRFYKELPGKLDALCISADLNIRESKNSDFTVMQVWARSEGQYYLVDQIRERMGWSKQKRALSLLAAKYPQVSAIYIEDAANGAALVEEARRSLPFCVPVRPVGDKASRLMAVSAMIEAGNVFLPDPSRMETRWVNGLIDEITFFPAAKNDDQLDCLSQALNSMRKRVYSYGRVSSLQGTKTSSLPYEPNF